MKFLDDYLSELFGCCVCDVKLEVYTPSRILSIVAMDTGKETALHGGRELLQVSVEFKAFDNDLPSEKGTLRKQYQRVLYSNLSDYTYVALQGKETTEMLKYALGFKEEYQC